MRPRGLLKSLFIGSVLLLPMVTSARSIPNFGPILEDGWNLCPLSWSAVIMTINNVITFSITLAIVFVAPVMIAYSGFLLVTNAFNPGAKADAKKILTNTILGIVIALAGWMIVDALMAVLYHPTDPGLAGKTWSELITGGGVPVCIPAASILRQAAPGAGSITGISETGVITTSTTGGATGYSYDRGIDAQVVTQSGALSALLACMLPKLPPGVGRISSISDSKITSGQYSFAQCATAPRKCAHAPSSCHYGGSGSCNGSSYAVDFGDQENMSALTAAARACGAKTLNEGDHLHVSVGSACGCDAGLY